MLDYSELATNDWLGHETRSWAGQREPEYAPRAIERRGDAPGLLEDLGRFLDSVGDRSPADLSRLLQTIPVQTALTEVLAQLGAARLMRFFHWLDEAGIPDSHLIVATLIEGDHHAARTLRSAVAVFTRSHVITRLFAADRLERLQIATEAAQKEIA